MLKDISSMIENRVTSIASLLSESSKCKVVLTKNSSTPYTDLETGTIYIPPIRVDSLSYENLCVFRRHLDHESFHVRYTKADKYSAAQSYIESQVDKFDPNLAGLCVNVVEDCRIDDILWNKFPGSRTSSIEAFRVYLEGLKDSELDDSIQIAHVVLYGVKGIENILDLRSVYRDTIVDGLEHGGFLSSIVQEIREDVLGKFIDSIFEPSLSLYNIIQDYRDTPANTVPDKSENSEGENSNGGEGKGLSEEEFKGSGLDNIESENSSDEIKDPEDFGLDGDSGDTSGDSKVRVSIQDWESVSIEKITASKLESVSQYDTSKIVNLTYVSLCKVKPEVPYNPPKLPPNASLMRSFRALKGIDNTDIRRSLRRGKVDPKYLYKVGFGKNNIFSKKDEIIDRNVGVCILLDLSGSMDNVYPQVTSTTMVLGNLLQSLGIQFNILGYTSNGFSSLRIKNTVPYEGDRVFIESKLDLYVLKTFEDNFKAVWRRVGSSIFSVFKTGICGSTPTAAALLESAEFLYSQRSLHKRVLIHVTDGHPTDVITNSTESFVDPFPVVKAIVDTLEKDKDFLCMGVGIGDEGIDAVELTHRKHVKVPDVYNITEDIIEGFESSIMSLYGK